MKRRNPHPFNPNMKALQKPLSKAERVKKVAENNEKHASAMRAIDDAHLNQALARELGDLEL